MTSVAEALANEGDSSRRASLELLSHTAVLNDMNKRDEPQSVSTDPAKDATTRAFKPTVNQNHSMNRISPDLPMDHPQNLPLLPHFYQSRQVQHHPSEDIYHQRRWVQPQPPSTAATAPMSWNEHYAHPHPTHFQQQHPLHHMHPRHYDSRHSEHTFGRFQPSLHSSMHIPRPVLSKRTSSGERGNSHAEVGYGFALQHQQSHFQQQCRPPPSFASAQGSFQPPLASMIGSVTDPNNQPHPESSASVQQHPRQLLQPPIPPPPPKQDLQQSFANESVSAPPPATISPDVVAQMRQELKAKDEIIASLQERLKDLEHEVHELRWLPTGKISQIPIADMVRIMEEYGSEVSTQKFSKRKHPIQRASVVRQFRRWNPEFFRYFYHLKGQWVPKLGKEEELQRRAERRRLLATHKVRVSDESPTTTVGAPPAA